MIDWQSKGRVLHTMLIHLVMIAWMAPMVSAGANCFNPLPGSAMIMHGVDLLTFDIGELNFKGLVVDTTCKQGKKKHVGETMFQLPDQVANWYQDNSRSLTQDIRIIQTSSDVTNTFNAGVTVEGSNGVVSGSGSVKYKEMQRTIAENEYFYSILEEKTKTGKMDIKKQPTLSGSAKYLLSFMDKPFKEAPKPYLRFIEAFGTHYFSSGSFGGVIHAEFKIKSSLKKIYSRRDLTVQTWISFNRQFSNASMKPAEAFEKSSYFSALNFYGGNIWERGMQAWLSTVPERQRLLSGNLSPISDLLKDQPKVQEQLELAVDSYYG